MPRVTFSIRTMLLAVTVVALYFPTRAIYEPWQQDRLRVSHHIYHDFTVHARISDGDSLADVRRHYELTLFDRDVARKHLVKQLSALGVVVKGNDEIYEYSVHGVGNVGYLQFRNGELVNHPRQQYADPIANTLRNGAKLPGFVDRMGVWPVYIAVAILLLLSWLALERAFAKPMKKLPVEPDESVSN